MKNIIICGVSRSGKTTLANRICEKYNYSLVSTDNLVSTFQNVYPELEISHKDEIKTSEKIAPFLHEYFRWLSGNKERKFIIEGYHMFPKDMVKFNLKDEFIIIYLGYPSLTPNEIFKTIRKYETEFDWTCRRSDDHMIEASAFFHDVSLMTKNDCEKYGFKFYDVSFDRNQVLEKIEEDILKDLK